MIRVLVWNEFFHEQKHEHIRAIYPEGIHGCIRDFLKTNEDLQVTTATLYDENIGLSDAARQFNNYRNMLNHASELMDPSERKFKFDNDRAYREGVAKDADPKVKAFHKKTTRGEGAYINAISGINGEGAETKKKRREMIENIAKNYKLPGMR